MYNKVEKLKGTRNIKEKERRRKEREKGEKREKERDRSRIEILERLLSRRSKKGYCSAGTTVASRFREDSASHSANGIPRIVRREIAKVAVPPGIPQ